MTHFSTDFVFDGSKPAPYIEADPAGPINVSGTSKLAGELRVLAASPEHLVVRVSWLYGSDKPAFPERLIGNACAEKEVCLPSDEIGCPTHTGDIAELLRPLIFAPDGPVGGVIHLCNSGRCTWQERGQHCVDIARAAGLPIKAARAGASSLDSIAAFVAKRPPNSAMSTGRYTRSTSIEPQPWQEARAIYLLQNKLYNSAPAIA